MAADEILKLQRQLEEAETDLQQSLSEVNHRVAAVDVTPRVDKLISHHPLASLSAAAVVGFAVGSSRSQTLMVGALLLGVLFGVGLGSARNEPEDD
jgi:ElaB/YqjD/DUF883 family membrane-anchored ribosome-binding protein